MLAILFCLSISEKSFEQDKEDLFFKFEPKEIDGNNFNGHLYMTIKNTSLDTIYIAIEPFSYFSLSDTINWYFMGRYKRYSSNYLFFIRHNARMDYRDAVSMISFLKYPNILYLYPGKRTTIFFKINKEVLDDMKYDIWYIKSEFGYAYKSDVDSALRSKPYFLNWEFKQSLFYKDTILIETEAGKSYKDSSLYIIKDGINYDYSYKSYYDSIITRCFIQRIDNF